MTEIGRKRRHGQMNKKGIICRTCGHEFKDIIWTNQASGMAATADQDGIYCGYGSQFDCDIYEWAAGQRVAASFGDICDVCIGLLLKKGKIIFIKNTFPEIWGKNIEKPSETKRPT